MAHEEIDGVPIWYEEHDDPNGPPLVALHGGILTFDGSFGDVLPWLTQGRRVIGVEPQGPRPHAPHRPAHVDRIVSRARRRSDQRAGQDAVHPGLPAEGILDDLDERLAHPELVDVDDETLPVLLAVSDNGTEMTSTTTPAFLATMSIAQHFGRPGTPTDQSEGLRCLTSWGWGHD